MPRKKAEPRQVRWLIRRDLPQVLEIEKACFEFAWTEEDFLCALRNRNCIGMVVEEGSRVIGFMIYELHATNIRILNFAVHPDHQRSSVGTIMAWKLKDKLSQQRRTTLTLEVREGNLPAQLFWKAMGFKALGVIHDRYDDTDEDAYLMRFKLESAMEPAEKWHPSNRISSYIEAGE